MEALAAYIGSLLTAMVTWLYNAFIDMFQYISDTLAAFCVVVANLIPDSCTTPLPTLPSSGSSALLTTFLQTLNWVFPISYFITLTEWMACGIMLFMMIVPLARWAKILN